MICRDHARTLEGGYAEEKLSNRNGLFNSKYPPAKPGALWVSASKAF